MSNDRKEMFYAYIKSNIAPILVDFINADDLDYATILPANIDKSELNGHYEGTTFMPPKWFKEVKKLLVIDKIDTISKEEQLKFIELLKYKKISTFEIPSDCIIIVTAKEINSDKINEEIYSLVAQI